jgi:nucleoside-diphosphate-sugar epimerase
MLNASLRLWYDTVLVEGSKSEESFCKQGLSYVDVRDLAEAHVKSLEAEKAGGERIIVSAGKQSGRQLFIFGYIHITVFRSERME